MKESKKVKESAKKEVKNAKNEDAKKDNIKKEKAKMQMQKVSAKNDKIKVKKDTKKKILVESKNGYFGEFGGCFVPEILHSSIQELQRAYKTIYKSKKFQKEFKYLLKHFVGRPTPLIYAKNASKVLNNNIYLKFEGLANTGAHKINNAIGQALLAKRMGKKHVIAETGAGQHGLAVASACAFLNIKCTIFMGEVDIKRQRGNVFLMQQFGAEVKSVQSGNKTLKDAVNEALRFWSTDSKNIFYLLGSAVGPYPYPDLVRENQKIISKEIKEQTKEYFKSLPDIVIACVGGGSNAIGAFEAFLKKRQVALVCVEAGGDDFKENRNAMRLSHGNSATLGIAHGYKSMFIQDKNGQLQDTYSISAGLDYAGVGPQFAYLDSINRAHFIAASDDEAIGALQFFAKHEGIYPALESSHALAGAIKVCKKYKNKNIVVNVSGRGDKDIFILAKKLDSEKWREFLQSEIDDIKTKDLKNKNK